jgi:hypothetical protein
MSRHRAVHYDLDADESDSVFCGTEGEFWPEHLTAYVDLVTCKRCRKILARIEARRTVKAMESKAGGWDSIDERVKQLGYTDPWDALADLCRSKGVPVFAEF